MLAVGADAQSEGKPMVSWCSVQNLKEKQCLCGVRCKNVRKSNVIAVFGAKATITATSIAVAVAAECM